MRFLKWKNKEENQDTKKYPTRIENRKLSQGNFFFPFCPILLRRIIIKNSIHILKTKNKKKFFRILYNLRSSRKD